MEKSAQLNWDQQKAIRNLELASTERITRLAESLGVVETTTMAKLRDTFRQDQPQTITEMGKYVTPYIDEAKQAVVSMETQLSLDIHLAVFYFPRYNEEVQDLFYEAIDDAIETAYQLQRDDVVEALEKFATA